jgi:hypothetical protein
MERRKSTSQKKISFPQHYWQNMPRMFSCLDINCKQLVAEVKITQEARIIIKSWIINAIWVHVFDLLMLFSLFICTEDKIDVERSRPSYSTVHGTWERMKNVLFVDLLTFIHIRRRVLYKLWIINHYYSFQFFPLSLSPKYIFTLSFKTTNSIKSLMFALALERFLN